MESSVLVLLCQSNLAQSAHVSLWQAKCFGSFYQVDLSIITSLSYSVRFFLTLEQFLFNNVPSSTAKQATESVALCTLKSFTVSGDGLRAAQGNGYPTEIES